MKITGNSLLNAAEMFDYGIWKYDDCALLQCEYFLWMAFGWFSYPLILLLATWTP